MFYAFEEKPGKGVCVAEIVGGLSLLCAGNKSSKLAVSLPLFFFFVSSLPPFRVFESALSARCFLGCGKAVMGEGGLQLLVEGVSGRSGCRAPECRVRLISVGVFCHLLYLA